MHKSAVPAVPSCNHVAQWAARQARRRLESQSQGARGQRYRRRLRQTASTSSTVPPAGSTLMGSNRLCTSGRDARMAAADLQNVQFVSPADARTTPARHSPDHCSELSSTYAAITETYAAIAETRSDSAEHHGAKPPSARQRVLGAIKLLQRFFALRHRIEREGWLVERWPIL